MSSCADDDQFGVGRRGHKAGSTSAGSTITLYINKLKVVKETSDCDFS